MEWKREAGGLGFMVFRVSGLGFMGFRVQGL